MGALRDFTAYWQGNSNLNAVIPYTQVYNTLVPEVVSNTFPYAVLTIIGSVPTYTIRQPYVEETTVQISVFHTDPDAVENIGDVIEGQFEFQPIAATTIACIRTNRVFVVDQDSPRRVYHVMMQFAYKWNKSTVAI